MTKQEREKVYTEQAARDWNAANPLAHCGFGDVSVRPAARCVRSGGPGRSARYAVQRRVAVSVAVVNVAYVFVRDVADLDQPGGDVASGNHSVVLGGIEYESVGCPSAPALVRAAADRAFAAARAALAGS